MTPYDGSDPMERAAGYLGLIFFLVTVGLPTVYGVLRLVLYWPLWELTRWLFG